MHSCIAQLGFGSLLLPIQPAAAIATTTDRNLHAFPIGLMQRTPKNGIEANIALVKGGATGLLARRPAGIPHLQLEENRQLHSTSRLCNELILPLRVTSLVGHHVFGVAAPSPIHNLQNNWGLANPNAPLWVRREDVNSTHHKLMGE